MSSESVQRNGLPSIIAVRTDVRRNPPWENLSKFGRAWIAIHLDEAKPALLLAQRAGCSERHAHFMLRGDRKPSLRAKHALDAEFISD